MNIKRKINIKKRRTIKKGWTSKSPINILKSQSFIKEKFSINLPVSLLCCGVERPRRLFIVKCPPLANIGAIKSHASRKTFFAAFALCCSNSMIIAANAENKSDDGKRRSILTRSDAAFEKMAKFPFVVAQYHHHYYSSVRLCILKSEHRGRQIDLAILQGVEWPESIEFHCQSIYWDALWLYSHHDAALPILMRLRSLRRFCTPGNLQTNHLGIKQFYRN